jgi:hypothetical protein
MRDYLGQKLIRASVACSHTAWNDKHDRAFSGKVESGFPFENATNARKLEHIQFPWKLNVL